MVGRGKEIELSDYRGHDRCPRFCRGGVTWWRPLPARICILNGAGRSVERLKRHSPFTILGVNSDSSKKIQKAIEENNIYLALILGTAEEYRRAQSPPLGPSVVGLRFYFSSSMPKAVIPIQKYSRKSQWTEAVDKLLEGNGKVE